ncbi:MAG: hypothetical protein ACI9GC_000684 [Phycisphaerales bacterium]|jgi:hypothetical protein
MAPSHFLLTSALISTAAFGHVQLLTPSGNDVLEVGTTFEVTWKITIPHDTINWDLYYSTSGQKGPWEPIAIDLPVGDNTQNSIHRYDWEIPNMPSENVWVLVVMDNISGNYDDTNDQPCSIVVPSNCAGDVTMDNAVNVTDLLAVIDQWGQQDSDADITGDGIVDVSDLLHVVANWGACV